MGMWVFSVYAVGVSGRVFVLLDEMGCFGFCSLCVGIKTASVI
jgi:hypothetical protein